MRSKYFVYAGLSIIAAVAGLFLYWYASPDKVLDVKNAPVPIRPEEVSGKDPITIATVDYCKLKNVDGRVVLSLVSQRTALLAPVQVERTPKGCAKIEAPLLVPPQATPDTYHWHWRVTYNINPIKTTVEEFDSKEFKLTGGLQ